MRLTHKIMALLAILCLSLNARAQYDEEYEVEEWTLDEEEEPKPAPPPEYVTMEEFKKFKEEMLNAKQSVQYQAKSKPNDSDRSANNNSGTGNAAK